MVEVYELCDDASEKYGKQTKEKSISKRKKEGPRDSPDKNENKDIDKEKKNDDNNKRLCGKENKSTAEPSKDDDEIKSTKSYWKHREKIFSKTEVRKLVAEFLKVLCHIIMSCHVYKFGGKTYLQQPHGCIGDEAIGVIANIIMIWWSRKFKAKLDELHIRNDLLKLYVDDINGTFGVIEKGTQFENGRLQFS